MDMASPSPAPGHRMAERQEAPHQKDRAIVFVTDAGFLVPSIVAALEIARQADVLATADIFILLVDLDDGLLEALRAGFAGSGIQFESLPSEAFLPPPDTFFNQTHITRTALGRFALHLAIPSHYRHVVYLDGDVQVAGDLGPLVRHEVAPGHIAAGNEFLWLCEGDHGGFWRQHRAYLTAIGIADPIDYFNSGVLAFRMDTWRDMAPRALAYFTAWPERCIYHDQSALNAVFAGRREVLSPAYNYGTEFALLGLGDAVKPRLIHFTGGLKPWFFCGPPWHGRFKALYDDAVAAHPVLDGRLKQPDARDLAGREAALRKARLRTRLLLPWRQRQRKSELRRYIRETPFAV